MLRPRFPEGKGQVERAPGLLTELRAAADDWTATVAAARRLRQLEGSVADALLVERSAAREAARQKRSRVMIVGRLAVPVS